ncbi:MAG: hypothetical protein H6672_03700 [Anaerolineaceae bacterium]|nr:hypothetical protein [Anaerolineaceae bacterium]
MRKSLFLILLFTFGLSLVSTAQDTTCPVIVQTALDTVRNLCDGTGRNQACYGNILLVAEPQPGATSLKFDTPGDLVSIADIQSLRLSSMNESMQEWGIAMLKLQANLPDTLPGQNVTFLLLGDVEIQNAVEELPEITVTVSASENINARRSPDGSIITTLAPGTALTANGRNTGSDWLRVILDEYDTVGWVAGFLLQSADDIQKLSVVQPDDVIYRPLQAFYLRTGLNDSACNEAPNSGLLIQTPEGAGEIIFTINEVNVRLHSTAFLQAEAGNALTINLLEGQAIVTAFEKTVTVLAGTQTAIPIDKNLSASGPPGDPEPYTEEAVHSQPISLLPQQIRVATPLTEAQIAARSACRASSSAAVNLRSGPGTAYTRLASLSANSGTIVIGQAEGRDGFVWWKLSGERWVRSDLVETSGNCSGVMVIPEEDLPPLPTPVPGAVVNSGSGNSSLVPIGLCISPVVNAGRITLNMGLSRNYWATCEDAVADGQRRGLATFTGTGPAPTNYRLSPGCHWNATYNEWGISTEADVVLTPGVYTYTGNWLEGETYTCTITVQ